MARLLSSLFLHHTTTDCGSLDAGLAPGSNCELGQLDTAARC
jgi:hypothetical protein